MSSPRDHEHRVVVRALRRRGRQPPLFFVSAPEVNALGWVSLARCLGADESPLSVQALGRRGRVLERDHEPQETAALAREYLAAVRAQQPRGPYYFAGMCEGAHIAFEMARRLEAEGERVALLAMIDTWPVENSSHYALVMLEALRQRFARMSGRARIAWFGQIVRRRIQRAGRGLRARLAGSAAAVVAAAPTPTQRWRARVWPGKGFVPPVYGGPITVLRVPRQPYYRLRDPSLGWATRSAQPVAIHVVSGDHQSLLRQPHVTAVANVLASCLAAARAGVGAPVATREAPRPA